ncbi:MAG: hypothetical protein U0325_05565 [Polyangiales bacterium]
MRLSHGFATGVLISALSGCFPEDRLNAPRDGSADVGARDVAAPRDIVAAPDASGMDAALPDVVAPRDVVDVALTDTPAAPTDVDLCAMVPTGRVPAMPVFNVEAGARDLAFDGRGNVALTAGNRINVAARGGSAAALVMDAGAEVTALRYTATGALVFTTSALTDAGTVQGTIWVLEPGAMTPTMRWSPTGRVDGLAVNPDGSVWYSDRTANTVYRFSVGDPAMPDAVVRGVAAPRALAFDATGRVLYVGGSAGVFRVNLDGNDGGVGTASPVFAGTDTVTGLATDTCGNLWVADERPMPAASRLLRWDGTQLSVIYESADGVRALAFGQGGDYDGRVIYFLQPGAGAMRAVGVVARGVPRPSAAP